MDEIAGNAINRSESVNAFIRTVTADCGLNVGIDGLTRTGRIDNATKSSLMQFQSPRVGTFRAGVPCERQRLAGHGPLVALLI